MNLKQKKREPPAAKEQSSRDHSALVPANQVRARSVVGLEQNAQAVEVRAPVATQVAHRVQVGFALLSLSPKPKVRLCCQRRCWGAGCDARSEREQTPSSGNGRWSRALLLFYSAPDISNVRHFLVIFRGYNGVSGSVHPASCRGERGPL